MNKWLKIASLSLVLAAAGIGLQTAQAQHGYAGHCHSHRGHHGGYGGYSVGYGGYGGGYSGYGLGYSPYAASYGRSLSYGSYYGGPSLSISRGSYYGGGLYPTAPYGVGGLGYPGIGYSRGPGVQLRIGF